MENEILNELQTIRSYLFVIMFAVIIWIIFRLLEGISRVFTGFKKSWDTYFENTVLKYLETGEYEKAIEECKEKLEKYPNHVDANWFLARAYLYTNKDELSKEHFEKTIDIMPE